jgi:hypothetical protein
MYQGLLNDKVYVCVATRDEDDYECVKRETMFPRCCIPPADFVMDLFLYQRRGGELCCSIKGCMEWSGWESTWKGMCFCCRVVFLRQIDQKPT